MPEIDEVMVIRLACSKLCHDLISPVMAILAVLLAMYYGSRAVG